MDENINNIIAQKNASPRNSLGWQIVWFSGHLVVVYGSVLFCTPWIAGLVRRVMMMAGKPISQSGFEFLLDHIFLFSFMPALLLGLFLFKFGHKAALLVWIPCAAILGYKFMTFPSPSIFSSQFSAAYHHYFEGAFMMPDLGPQDDYLALASGDAIRALAQLQITAPFYAAIGYCVGSLVGNRLGLTQKISDQIEQWESSRFQREGEAGDVEESSSTDGHAVRREPASR